MFSDSPTQREIAVSEYIPYKDMSALSKDRVQPNGLQYRTSDYDCRFAVTFN